MPRMSNTLGLPEPRDVKDPATKALLYKWQRILEAKYKDTYTDVHHKQWQYFDIDQTRWRIGPYPPRTPTLPDGNFAADVADFNFEIQYFTGDDYANQWRDNSYWQRKARSWAGTD